MREMKKSDKEKEEIIKPLRLFNEKADKLMSLGFTKSSPKNKVAKFIR